MHLNSVLKHRYPFAIWSLPNSTNWEGIAQNDNEIVKYSKDFSEGFLVAPYKSAKHAVLIRKDSEITAIEACQKSSSDYVNSSLDIELPKEINKEIYLEECKYIIESIKKGGVQKVVLSRVKIEECSHHPAELFLKLLAKYPKAMVFMFSLGKEIWIGASPEILLKVEDKKFITMALAGSKPINSLHDWTQKERREQAYVEEYIEKILHERSLEYVKKGPYTIEAGPVSHLKSEYSGVLSKNNFIELLKDLHPTPAVCGIPLKHAQIIIDECESHDRSYYSGYFGPVTNNKISIFVNLRSAMIHDNKMYLFLGGGITSDSDPTEEWNETELKAKTLLSIL